MPPNRAARRRVVWSIQAHDALENAYSGAGTPPSGGIGLLAAIEAKLLATFPKADTIVVLDRIPGYSTRAEKHVLRVEVHEPQRTLSRVVKIGKRANLTSELKGWQSCARSANDRGRAFMTLQPGGRVTRDGGAATLVYEDAHQTLRAAELVSLEQAVLNSLRWGVPSITSILAVLDQIFAELIDRLYSRAHTLAMSESDAKELWDRLAEGYDSWKNYDSVKRKKVITVPGLARDLAYGNVPKGPFVDLVTFHDQVFTLYSADMFPEVRRGPSHGDLHGRNILVGLVDGEARWPAVFDYEHMRLDNYLGWDFVKLEVELKIRGLPLTYSDKTAGLIEKVDAFETELDEETEELNNLPFADWRQGRRSRDFKRRFKTAAEQCLSLVLLEIRRQAKKCLEHIAGRGRRWLHEYYFLLACYAVYSGRFDAYGQLDATVAYVCGSIAATRYLWAINRQRFSAEDAAMQASNAIAVNDPKARLQGPPSVSPHVETAFAAKFARSRQEAFVREAIIILQKICQRVSYFAAAWQELALAYLELGVLAPKEKDDCFRGAFRTLQQFNQEQQGLFALEVETLSRWGRMWKDLGDKLEDGGEEAVAAKFYEMALGFYWRAFDLHKNYYPGVNAATSALLCKKKKDSERLALQVNKILDREIKNKPEMAYDLWVLATRGEVQLLLDKHRTAARWYRKALNHRECTPHAHEAIVKQILRILKRLPDDGQHLASLVK